MKHREILNAVDIIQFLNVIKKHNSKWVENCSACAVPNGECNKIASKRKCKAWDTVKNKDQILKDLQ